MSLSDSLSPSGPSLESRVLTPAPAVLTAEQTVDVQVSGLISAGLQRVYGGAGEQARTGIAEARAAEGAGAFDRIASTPGAFAPVADAAHAPHLREAYVYQEWVAVGRGVSLPDTHLLETPGSSPASGQALHDTRVLGPAQDTETIRNLLDPEAHPLSLDYGVTRDDVDAIGEIVRSFSNVEYGSRVLSGLDNAALQRWADNLDDPTLQGGLNAAERSTHYAALAKNLDATQFGRFAEAVVRAGNAEGPSGDGGIDEARWFSHAASETAPVETLGSFAQQATARGRRSSDESLAPAVAEAMRGLVERGPQTLARVLAPYSKEDTQWLVSGAAFQQVTLGSASHGGAPSATIDHDAVSLNRAIYAVARVGNLETKGMFFAAAAREMETLRETPPMSAPYVVNTGTEEATGHVRLGLSHIVHSDTAGVMATLARSADPNGTATVAFAEAQLEAGETSRMQSTIRTLLQGNGRQQGALERFGPEHNAEPSKVNRDNAAALGHYAGAIAGAIQNRSTDRTEQTETLKNIFSGVLTVGIAGAGPATAGGRLVQATAGALAQPLAESIAASLQRFSDREANLSETLLEVARPQVPNVGSSKGGVRPHEGLAVTNDFTDSFDHVVVTNRDRQHR